MKECGVKFAGLKLKNPYIASSGCFGYGWEGEKYFPNLEWGAVVSKTISLKERKGNPPPRIFEVPEGMINRVGLQNCGLDNFLKRELPQIKKLPYPVIVSIFGEKLKEWKLLVKILAAEKVKAIELNLSCPNLKGEVLVRKGTKCVQIVRDLKAITSLPILAKINALDEPVELSRKLKEAGVDAVVCSNSLPAAVIHKGTIYKGGLSGPAIKPVVLRAVREIKENVDVDLAACGGITSRKDIEDYRIAGAKAFVFGSILLSKPDIMKQFRL